MRGAAADTPLLRAIAQRSDHLGVIGQAQIVVGAEGQQALAVDQHFRALRAFQQRALAEQLGGTAFGEAGGKIERHGRTPVGANSFAKPARE
ncbi:hypothetical protein D9M70_507140 [compost metagenome]